MAPNANSQTPVASDIQTASTVPPWWRAEQEHFAALAETRLRIHLHEKSAARKAVSVLVLAVAAAVSIYSMDAVSAVGVPAASGIVLLFIAIAIPTTIAWLLDCRLTQQLNDIDLRSKLWLDLVDAVKHGHIDLAEIGSVRSDETEIESFLRQEIAVAAQFLASRNTLAPHLPLFGHCFTLEHC